MMTTTTMPGVSETPRQSDHNRFIDLLGSEWTKLITVRSTVWTLVGDGRRWHRPRRHRDLCPSLPLVKPVIGRPGGL